MKDGKERVRVQTNTLNNADGKRVNDFKFWGLKFWDSMYKVPRSKASGRSVLTMRLGIFKLHDKESTIEVLIKRPRTEKGKPPICVYIHHKT